MDVKNGREAGEGDKVDSKTTITKGFQASGFVHTKGSALTDSDAYSLDYPNTGKCIIINNKNFEKNTGMAERCGTDVDAKNVLKVFSELGFKTKTYNDLSASKMMKILYSASQEDHSMSAMFACVILSHGDEDMVYGVDKPIHIKEISAYFRGNLCSSLAGKPKLFFIQACRGSNLDCGVELEVDSVGDSDATQKIPVEADFLYMYSTAPGYYAWRNTANGSWFISALCQVLTEHGREMEILQLMTRVNRKVAIEYQSSSNSPGFNAMKQIPCIVSMLTKDLYFRK